jgi:hypothetical protein
MRPLSAFGVETGKSPAENRRLLQEAIDWAAERGAALLVEPSDAPVPVESGLVLRRNVSLVGVHGPVGRGTSHPTRRSPVGSVLAIMDAERPLLTVESATQVCGLQFHYPLQSSDDPARLIDYPATIRASREISTQGVTLSCLTFYGESLAFDFRCSREVPCEQILIEHCYGYPLSGTFVAIDHCYDVPRILHCHVNPANRRLFAGQWPVAIVDAVASRGAFAFDIDHTDNAQLIDVFTFGTHGGARLGAASYGQLTNFNFDCVSIGIHKLGDNDFNRNWQIAQGSIIANVGRRVQDIHPVVVEGRGHTAITNVESFSGPNAAITNLGMSEDYLLVRGSDPLSVSLFGCRMRNYAADRPVTLDHTGGAVVMAVACIDKQGRPFEMRHD